MIDPSIQHYAHLIITSSSAMNSPGLDSMEDLDGRIERIPSTPITRKQRRRVGSQYSGNRRGHGNFILLNQVLKTGQSSFNSQGLDESHIPDILERGNKVKRKNGGGISAPQLQRSKELFCLHPSYLAPRPPLTIQHTIYLT